MRERIRGFYSILDAHDEALARILVRPVELGGCGSNVLQVRLKPASVAEITLAARMARAVCDEYGALCIVNDRVDIALVVGADGVHLGQNDLPIDKARAVVERMTQTRASERPFLIGISTNTRAQIEAAVAADADYVAFGPVFPTATKTDANPVRGLSGLRRAVAAARGIPVVAIGGITPDRADDIARTGAAAACAIDSVNHALDVARAGARLGASFLE